MLLHADGGGGAKDTNAQHRTHEISLTDLSDQMIDVIGHNEHIFNRQLILRIVVVVVVSVLDNEHIVK